MSDQHPCAHVINLEKVIEVLKEDGIAVDREQITEPLANVRLEQVDVGYGIAVSAYIPIRKRKRCD